MKLDINWVSQPRILQSIHEHIHKKEEEAAEWHCKLDRYKENKHMIKAESNTAAAAKCKQRKRIADYVMDFSHILNITSCAITMSMYLVSSEPE